MSISVILFEDQTSQQFRPLSWSLPVYEIPCGMFNLRERLEILCDRAGLKLGLLPRGLLLELQKISARSAADCGPDGCRRLINDSETVLLLSSRVMGAGVDLSSLLAGRDAMLAVDADGLLARRCSRDQALQFLADWEAWDQETLASGGWTNFTGRVAALAHGSGDGQRGDVRAWRHLWERIHDIAEFIRQDLVLFVDAGEKHGRRYFGIQPETAEPVWGEAGGYHGPSDVPVTGVHLLNPSGIRLGPDVTIDPSAVIDARPGPVIIDRGAHIMPHTYLQGPLYIGAQTIVKSGATIYGETAIGAVCRVAGEIAESQLLPFMNKQHAGFLGHAVIGSWVNLGADTTCSDLKNNYGLLKVNYGQGPVETDSRFIGLMLAEHVKSAIGTTFNTATTVGFSSNVFAPGFPRAVIPNFAWGDGRQKVYDVERAIEVAEIVMNRRGIRFSKAHGELFHALAVKSG